MKYSQRVTTRSHSSRWNQHKLPAPTNLSNWLPVIAHRKSKSHGQACLDKGTRVSDFVKKVCACKLLCSHWHCKLQNLAILLHWRLWCRSSSNWMSFFNQSFQHRSLDWAAVLKWQVEGLCGKGRRKKLHSFSGTAQNFCSAFYRQQNEEYLSIWQLKAFTKVWLWRNRTPLSCLLQSHNGAAVKACLYLTNVFSKYPKIPLHIHIETTWFMV